jgi:competence protein ComEA
MRALFMLLAIAAVISSGAIPAAAAQKPSSPKVTKVTRVTKPTAVTKTAIPAPTATSPINLNTATQAELEALPGVGAKAAGRVLEYRQKNGNFKKVEDLMNVKGFGEKTFLKLKPLLTVTEKAAPSGVSDR